MTLRETIALLRQKTEGFRFYILRFLRVFFLYKLFVATVETCVAMMSANGTGDPESVSYNPWEYYGSTSISILIVFIFFAGIFILYDPTAWLKEKEEKERLSIEERVRLAQEAEAKKKAEMKAALKAEILAELKEAGIIKAEESKETKGGSKKK